MDFGIEQFLMLKMKSDKRKTTEGMKLSNQK